MEKTIGLSITLKIEAKGFDFVRDIRLPSFKQLTVSNLFTKVPLKNEGIKSLSNTSATTMSSSDSGDPIESPSSEGGSNGSSSG